MPLTDVSDHAELEVSQHGKQLGFLWEGFFGESPVIEAITRRGGFGDQIRKRTVTTTCICELGMIRKGDIVQLMDDYPELTIRLRRFATAFSSYRLGAAIAEARQKKKQVEKKQVEKKQVEKATAAGAKAGATGGLAEPEPEPEPEASTQSLATSAAVPLVAELRAHVDRRFDELAAQLDRLAANTVSPGGRVDKVVNV